MKYTVLLTPKAEAELTELWVSTANQAELGASADFIDRLLKRDPETAGVVVFDTVRRLHLPPLAVEYEVIEEDRMVWVLAFFDPANESD
jgi:hypothetical protein